MIEDHMQVFHDCGSMQACLSIDIKMCKVLTSRCGDYIELRPNAVVFGQLLFLKKLKPVVRSCDASRAPRVSHWPFKPNMKESQGRRWRP